MRRIGNQKQALSAVSVEDIIAFFRPKVEDWALGKGLNIAFDQIAALTGLDRIIDGDGNGEILNQLNVINDKLDGISNRLKQLGDLSEAIQKELAQLKLDELLGKFCDMKITTQTIFTDFYVP